MKCQKSNLQLYKRIEIHQLFFKGISERVLGKEAVKEGQELPDVIRKLFSVEDAALGAKIKDPITGKIITKDVETTDFVNAAVDTVIEQSKQIYGRRAFDTFLEKGKDSFNKPGFIFTREDLVRKGLLNNPRLFNNLKNIASREQKHQIYLNLLQQVNCLMDNILQCQKQLMH